MEFEKNFTLKTGRIVRLIIPEELVAEELALKADVMIKDPGEHEFRVPIGASHPKYWKLKNLDPAQAKLLQMKYSGISDKQLRKARKELQMELN